MDLLWCEVIKLKIEKSEEYGDKNKISTIIEFEESMLDDEESTAEEITVEVQKKLDIITHDLKNFYFMQKRTILFGSTLYTIK